MDVVTQDFGKRFGHDELQRGFALTVEGECRALGKRGLKENRRSLGDTRLDYD